MIKYFFIERNWGTVNIATVLCFLILNMLLDEDYGLCLTPVSMVFQPLNKK